MLYANGSLHKMSVLRCAANEHHVCTYMYVVFMIGLNSMECYDPRINEWRFVASMSTRRSSVGVGVVGGK